MSLAVEELLAITTAREAALSPDGERVAFVVYAVEGRSEVPRLRVIEASREERELALPVEGRGPAWSPDGSSLAYLIADAGKVELRLHDQPLATFVGAAAGRPRFSPRGDRIALVLRPAPGRSVLAVVSADGAVETIEAEPEESFLGPCWSPDGELLAFGRSRPGADGIGPTSQVELWLPGDAPEAIETGLAYATCPSFAPDGGTLALVGVPAPRLGHDDPGLRPWLVEAGGGEARPAGDGPEGVVLAPEPVGPTWSASGALYLRLARRGAIELACVDLVSKFTTTLVGDRQVVDFSLVGERVAYSTVGPDDPGSIHLLDQGTDKDGGTSCRLKASVGEWTHERAGEVRFPAHRTFLRADGRELDGWVAGVDSDRAPQPTLLAFHGGPHGYFGPGFQRGHFYRDVLASRGWAILAVNSTGSGSYGAKFADDLRGVWGERDLAEQLGALDELVAAGISDPDRLAVAGYSYGGYLAAWTIARDDRFAAAVIGAPIADLESFAATSDIGSWYTPWEMNGPLEENRERHRMLSPATHADAVKTPALILHGEADRRVPFAQGQLLRDRIAAAGAPVEFVAYPGAGHLFYSSGGPAERVDFNRRVLEFLEARIEGRGAGG